MRIEARETARLYQVLSDKLGNETTEAMFKYIEGKTENTVEASIKTLATKDELFATKDELNRSILAVRDELFSVKDELNRSISSVRDELFSVKDELKAEISGVREVIGNVRKEISESKADTIKWMFIFWIGQVAATLAIILLYIKK